MLRQQGDFMECKLPKRKSPRAQWGEYNEGLYFVTVCTGNHKFFFGQISEGKIKLSEIGRFLANELETASLHHPHVRILQYVVMPNHFHAIVKIMEDAFTSDYKRVVRQPDAARNVPTSEQRLNGCGKGDCRPLLSSYVGSLKSAVTKYAHQCKKDFSWQPRYHDHIIRGVQDGNNISTYIENNVANWTKDCFYLSEDI